MCKEFYDKYGRKIKNGDILIFSNKSIYKVIETDETLCIKCETRPLPLFELKNIVCENTLVSAYKK